MVWWTENTFPSLYLLQVGFGNVAAETDNEKVFTICMMIIAGVVIDVPLRCRLREERWETRPLPPIPQMPSDTARI